MASKDMTPIELKRFSIIMKSPVAVGRVEQALYLFFNTEFPANDVILRLFMIPVDENNTTLH